MLTVVLVVGTLAPVATPCALWSDCPCEGPPGAEHHADEGVDEHADASSGHESDDQDAGDPCDDDCPDDCPSCSATAVALVTPALGMPGHWGTWRELGAVPVPESIHRVATSGVLRPPRWLG